MGAWLRMRQRHAFGHYSDTVQLSKEGIIYLHIQISQSLKEIKTVTLGAGKLPILLDLGTVLYSEVRLGRIEELFEVWGGLHQPAAPLRHIQWG
jgi:hypothetical protein